MPCFQYQEPISPFGATTLPRHSERRQLLRSTDAPYIVLGSPRSSSDCDVKDAPVRVDIQESGV